MSESESPKYKIGTAFKFSDRTYCVTSYYRLSVIDTWAYFAQPVHFSDEDDREEIVYWGMYFFEVELDSYICTNIYQFQIPSMIYV